MGRYDKFKKLVLPLSIVKDTVTISLPGYPGKVAVASPGNEGIELVTWIQERIDDGSILTDANATDVTALITLTGVAEGSEHLGTFPGSIISDNSTIKQALLLLENFIENLQISVITDSSLSGAGTSGDPLIWPGASVSTPLSGSGLSSDPLEILAGGITATYIANNTITFNKLSQSGATTGQLITWDGFNWVAADPVSGADGNGIYTGSGNVPSNVVATLTDNITFTTDNESGYFFANIGDLFGSNLLLNTTQARLRFYNIGGNNEVVADEDGLTLTVASGNHAIIKGGDARYFADYSGTFVDLSIPHKKYVDDLFATISSTDTIYTADGSIPDSTNRTVTIGNDSKLSFLYNDGNVAFEIGGGDPSSGSVFMRSQDTNSGVYVNDAGPIIYNSLNEIRVYSDKTEYSHKNLILYSQTSPDSNELITKAYADTTYLTSGDLSGLVNGTGVANRIAYWSDADTLTSNAGLTYDGTTFQFSVTDSVSIQEDNITVTNDNFYFENTATNGQINFYSSTGNGYFYVQMGADSSNSANAEYSTVRRSTTQNQKNLYVSSQFYPTGTGTNTFRALTLDTYIDQSAGHTGIVTDIYVKPTILTTASDYRGIYLDVPTGHYSIFSDSGKVRLDFGSDATGDIPYRNSSGNLARLGVGTDGQVLTLASGLPSWANATTKLNLITAATATNTINSADYTQDWQWNTISSGTGMKFSSTSTAAASNSQKLVEVALSGTNSTSSQITYAFYSSNTHAGTGAINYGVAGIVSGGTSLSVGVYGSAASNATGVAGVSSSGSGVSGTSSSGTGGTFTSATGNAITGGTNSTTIPALSLNNNSTVTNAVQQVAHLISLSTNTPANGLGAGLGYYIEDSSNTGRAAGTHSYEWTDVTTGTRTSKFKLSTVNSGTETTKMEIAGTGAVKLNTYGVNTFAGTPAYALGVDASGNVVEFSASGGGNGIYGGSNTVPTNVTATLTDWFRFVKDDTYYKFEEGVMDFFIKDSADAKYSEIYVENDQIWHGVFSTNGNKTTEETVTENGWYVYAYNNNVSPYDYLNIDFTNDRFRLKAAENAGDFVELIGTKTTLTIEGTSGFAGAQYNADYSADFTSRSLVDKGYVDAAVAAGLSDGDKGDIIVSSSGTVWTIDNDVVTYAKMQNVSATNRFLGRITSGPGDTEELTGTQATTLLDVFTSGLKGLVPASGGGTTNFLRADGNWAAPTAALADGDYGDITVGSSGTTLTIDNLAVTNAKINDVSMSKLTSGTLGSGVAGTLPSSSTFRVNFFGGNTGWIVDDAANATSIFSKNGNNFFSADNTAHYIGTLTGVITASSGTVSTKTNPSGAFVGTTDTQTLTNKRIDPRVSSTASSTTPTPNADTDDVYILTALAGNATFGAPTGTPVQGQKLLIRIKDNGTARTLAYNAVFRAIGITLPTTTVINKTTYIGCVYNSTDTKWDCIATTTEA